MKATKAEGQNQNHTNPKKRYHITLGDMTVIDQALIDIRHGFPIGTIPKRVDSALRIAYGKLCEIINREENRASEESNEQ